MCICMCMYVYIIGLALYAITPYESYESSDPLSGLLLGRLQYASQRSISALSTHTLPIMCRYIDREREINRNIEI